MRPKICNTELFRSESLWKTLCSHSRIESCSRLAISHYEFDEKLFFGVVFLDLQVKTVYTKVKESLRMDNRKTTDVCIDDTMTDDIAPFFTQAR